MYNRRRHILALVLGERGLELAEVRARRSGTTIERRSTLPFADALDAPRDAGEALAKHLREHGYAARHVVVGLPATRLLARRKLMPQPPSERHLQDMLRLTIERDLTAGGRDLCIDYHKHVTSDGRASVLLIATAQDVVARVRELAAAAALEPVAITPTALALSATREPADAQGALVLDETGGELLLHSDGGPTALTHVRLPATDESDEVGAVGAGGFAQAVMRALAGSGSDAAPPRIEVMHGSDVAEPTAHGVATALREWGEVAGPTRVAPAEALALASVREHGLKLDLAHSKLTIDPRAGQRRRRRVAMLSGAIVVLLMLLGASVWQRAATAVAELERQYEAVRDEAERLQRVRDRTLAAAPWFADEPVHLACLWNLTRLFPDSERVWVSHLRLGGDGAGLIQGRAASRRTMIALLEAMQESPAFDEVQLRNWQEAGDGDGDVRFDVSFRHVSRGVGG